MYLERGGEGVVGLFYDKADWKTTLLGGSWAKDDTIQITTSIEGPDLVTSGKLKGRVTVNGFEGVWTPKDSNTSQPVHMKAEPEPPCGGNGAWRKFSDSKWPITFWYPAAWHLQFNKD